MRLSAISFAGTARTLVAVGTASDASMFCTMWAATPRIGLVLTPAGVAFAALAGAAVGSAFAGAGAALAGADGAAGAAVADGVGSAWPGRRASPRSYSMRSRRRRPRAATPAAGAVAVAPLLYRRMPSRSGPRHSRRAAALVPLAAGPPANASAGL